MRDSEFVGITSISGAKNLQTRVTIEPLYDCKLLFEQGDPFFKRCAGWGNLTGKLICQVLTSETVTPA